TATTASIPTATVGGNQKEIAHLSRGSLGSTRATTFRVRLIPCQRSREGRICCARVLACCPVCRRRLVIDDAFATCPRMLQGRLIRFRQLNGGFSVVSEQVVRLHVIARTVWLRHRRVRTGTSPIIGRAPPRSSSGRPEHPAGPRAGSSCPAAG